MTSTDPGTSDGPESTDSSDTSVDDGSSTGSGVAPELAALRIELACMAGFCQYNPADVCAMDPTVADQGTLTGEATVVYDVTLRVRGVVEMSTFAGGVLDGPVYVGGDVDSYWSPYSLVVSEPAQTYWLNPLGDGDLFTYGVDYVYVLPIADGATVELRGGSGDDSCGLFNHGMDGAPIVVDGLRPAPAPFDGQFLQVDVESIVPAL